MTMFVNSFVLIVALFSAVSCSNTVKENVDDVRVDPPVPEEKVATKVTLYEESNEDFPNPERGFYRYSATKTSSYTALSESQLRGYRNQHTPSGSSFSINSTLVFRYFVIDDANNAALSAQTLQKFGQDFNIARAAGVKLIPRFVYTTTATPGNCPEGFICPPYGDAPKNIVLQHILQLKPLFHEHQDVIAVVQIGFIGTWGEQYYTDHFGDPSSNGNQGNKLRNQDWNDRREVLEALLDAVPKSRMVQVRYPQMKQRFLHGVTAPYTTTGMTLAQAFNESDAARIGLHNDCFLSGRNDIGTFEDYGNNTSPRSSNNAVVLALRQYAMNEGKYTAVGGETCRKDPAYPDCNCAPAGRAVDEMASMHYSYLNVNYNQALNNDWEAQGCADDIKRKLGYRFVLKRSELPISVSPGTVVPIKIDLENVGFASPYNKRTIKLVLRHNQSGAKTVINLATDVRKWFTGLHTLNEQVTIPQNLAAGVYDVLLSLHDESSSIADRPEYAIRLANNTVWEASTGLNSLKHQITIL